jgi:hypothetical protein
MLYNSSFSSSCFDYQYHSTKFFMYHLPCCVVRVCMLYWGLHTSEPNYWDSCKPGRSTLRGSLKVPNAIAGRPIFVQDLNILRTFQLLLVNVQIMTRNSFKNCIFHDFIQIILQTNPSDMPRTCLIS